MLDGIKEINPEFDTTKLDFRKSTDIKSIMDTYANIISEGKQMPIGGIASFIVNNLTPNDSLVKVSNINDYYADKLDTIKSNITNTAKEIKDIHTKLANKKTGVIEKSKITLSPITVKERISNFAGSGQANKIKSEIDTYSSISIQNALDTLTDLQPAVKNYMKSVLTNREKIRSTYGLNNKTTITDLNKPYEAIVGKYKKPEEQVLKNRNVLTKYLNEVLVKNDIAYSDDLSKVKDTLEAYKSVLTDEQYSRYASLITSKESSVKIRPIQEEKVVTQSKDNVATQTTSQESKIDPKAATNTSSHIEEDPDVTPEEVIKRLEEDNLIC